MPNHFGAPPKRETAPVPAEDPGATLTQRLLRGVDSLSVRLGRTSNTASHLVTGLRGEEDALFHLKSRGYVIVARRWSTPKLPGDVDLIAWEGETLCFIEVKTRTGRNIVPAEFSVDHHKQKTLRSLAAIFRKRFPEPVRRLVPVRFDVVSVYLPPAGTDLPVEIDLFRGAFERYRS
jgi:putative endonuclease